MAGDDLDDDVRREDPDRWMSSRFIADPAERSDVITLYAFDGQLSRATRVASNTLVAEIRLAWWREVVEEAYGGGPTRAHPVARRLTAAIARHDLPRERLEAMVEARIEALDQPRLDWAGAVRWADGVAGSAAMLVARILDPRAPAESAALAGRVWGLAKLVEMNRVEAVAAAAWIVADISRASHHARALGSAAFPAVAHATLARDGPAYLSVAGRSGIGADLGRRLRLVWAVATGRL